MLLCSWSMRVRSVGWGTRRSRTPDKKVMYSDVEDTNFLMPNRVGSTASIGFDPIMLTGWSIY